MERKLVHFKSPYEADEEDNKEFDIDDVVSFTKDTRQQKDTYYEELRKNYVALKMEKMRVRTQYVSKLQELQRKSRDLDRYYKSNLAKLKLKIIPELSKMYEIDKLEGLVKKPNNNDHRWELADEVREYNFVYCGEQDCGNAGCNGGFINKNLLTYEEF